MPDAIAPIGMRITADLSDFSPKMKTASDDVSGFTSRSKQSLENLQGALQATRSQASGFFSAFGQNSGGFSAATSGVEGLVSSIASGTSAWGAFAAAGVGAMGAIATAASRTAGQIQDLNKLSRTLGTSTQDTQVLQRVFSSGGMDDNSSRATVLRFSSQIGAGAADSTSREAEAFHRINLDPSKLAERSLPNALEQTMTMLRNIPNRREQDSAARGIFGKGFDELESAIQSPRAFDRARDAVAVGGVTNEQADRQRGTSAFRRETEDLLVQSGGSVYQKLTRAWNEFSTLFDRGAAQFERASGGAGILANLAVPGIGIYNAVDRYLNPQAEQAESAPARRTGIELDRYTAPTGPSAADKAAQKLIDSWEKDADLFTRNARASQQLRGTNGGDAASESELRRTAEILRQTADGASESQLRQLRVNSDILTTLERRADLERSLVGVTDRTRTSFETFQTSLRSFDRLHDQIFGADRPGAFNAVDPAQAAQLGALGRGRAQAFLTLERTLGSGPSSYAQSGIDPRSTQGANYLNDLQVRREVAGQSVEDRIRMTLEAVRDVNRQQLDELEKINQGLQNIGPLAQFNL